jgi:hypothetical protein
MATPAWHNLGILEIYQQLGSHPEGLTDTEVTDRLAQSGRNEITRRKPVSPWRLLLKQFANYFILILLFAAILAFTVSFLPGESGRRLTAYFILGIIVLSVALNFFEEYHAQKELEALERLLMFKTPVLRNGIHQHIDAAEVVPGDILVLTHGQKVPADACLIEAYSLRTDESALTGGSLGVDKSPEPVAPDATLAERTNMVYASTYISHGTGLAVAVSTGMATEVGQISSSLEQMAERPTPFQVEVKKMARQMTVIVAALAVVVAGILLFVLHEPPVDVALNTLSLAIATIPESLPIVLTFALALGARQMARRKAVVRRLSVVESLGSVDTICTDKTGTLTQNPMTLQRLYVGGQMVEISQGIKENHAAVELLQAAILCNEAMVSNGADSEVHGDPVDTALIKATQLAGLDPYNQNAHADFFDPEWMFGIEGGFDVVIGNPPYIGEKGHKEIFRPIAQSELGKRFYQGKMDLFYFFFHLALDFGKPSSSIAFITTNYYPTAMGCKKLRQDFKVRAIIRNLINFNELKIFESALGQHNMISIIRKGNNENAISHTCITRRKGIASSEILQKIIEGNDSESEYHEIAQKDLYDGDECYIRLAGNSKNTDDPTQKTLNKIKDQGVLLATICNVNQGIVTGADKVSKKHLDKYEIGARIGDGIFVLSEKEIEGMEFLNLEKSVLKPWFKNSDIGQYWTKVDASERLIDFNFTSRPDINRFPTIKKHLRKFKKMLEERPTPGTLISAFSKGYWWVLTTSRQQNFNGSKIVAPQRSIKCVIRSKATSESGASRPPNPEHVVH